MRLYHPFLKFPSAYILVAMTASTVAAASATPGQDTAWREHLVWHNGFGNDAAALTKYFRATTPDNLDWVKLEDGASRDGCAHLTAVGGEDVLMYQHFSGAKVMPGGRYRLVARVRGDGMLALGHAPYEADSRWKDGLPPPDPARTSFGSQHALTDSWTDIRHDFVVRDPGAALIRVLISLKSGSRNAWIEQVGVYQIEYPAYELTVMPYHPMLPCGTTATWRVQLHREGTPVRGAKLLVYEPRGADTVPSEAILPMDADGRAEYALAATKPGIFRYVFAHPASGAHVSAYVDVVDAETHAHFRDIASRVAIEKPAHILILGDSLTDMRRGYNWVDKVRFWLSGEGAGNVSVKNAAIGGDTITRILNRMGGRLSQAERDRYPQWHDLFRPVPDIVFIWTGHNDSKLTGDSNWQKAYVPPDRFEADLRAVLCAIRKQSEAKIVLMSTACGVPEITRARVDDSLKQGVQRNLFSDPEQLQRYNAIIRRVADETGCRYLDIYTPTRDAPESRKLFYGDGIHLSDAGNRFVSEVALRFLDGATNPADSEMPLPGAETFYQAVPKVLDAIEAMVPDLARSAAAAAGRYVDDETLRLGVDGSECFVREATYRSGGLIQVDRPNRMEKDSWKGMVLYALRDGQAEQDGMRLAEYAKRGCPLVVFGTKHNLERLALSSMKLLGKVVIPAGVKNQQKNRPDGPPASTDPLALMATLWPWVGEYVAACTRQGMMPPMYQSIRIPEGRTRNDGLKEVRFHKEAPQPVDAGVLTCAYMQAVRDRLDRLWRREGETIRKIARIAVARKAAGGQLFMVGGAHGGAHIAEGTDDPGLFTDITQAWREQHRRDFPSDKPKIEFKPDDLLLVVGYDYVPNEGGWHNLVEKARQGGAMTVLCIATFREDQMTQVEDSDILLPMPWELGDAEVDLPGYDVNILPSSNVLAAAIYGMINAEVLSMTLPQ